jgi:Fic family protein
MVHMSSQIQQDRDDYYLILEDCQKGTLDITLWMTWYLNCLHRAIGASEKILGDVLAKVNFWKMHGANLLTTARARSSTASSMASRGN